MFLQNNAILSVDSDGIVSVSGGSFSMNGLSKASVIQGQIEILGNNLLVSGSSQLEVDGTRSSLKVDGGDFVVDQSGSLVLFNSGRLDVLNGNRSAKRMEAFSSPTALSLRLLPLKEGQHLPILADLAPNRAAFSTPKEQALSLPLLP